jgi:hypothetical protein
VECSKQLQCVTNVFAYIPLDLLLENSGKFSLE